MCRTLAPAILLDTFEPSSTYDIELDVNAAPGSYHAELVFESNQGQATYFLSADILPTPDFDRDGQLSNVDMDLLGIEVATASNDPFFDLTGDGNVDGDDVSNFLGLANKLNGDIDFNGKVEFADFLTMASNFNQMDQMWTNGDFDTNGSVEFADFLILSSNFGQSTNLLASVPEPSAIHLMLPVMLLVRSVRRKLAVSRPW